MVRMETMEFKKILTKFREQAGFSKTELAQKIGLVNGNYFVGVEAGRVRPPTLERCRQIAQVLKLDDDDADLLIKTAAEERMQGAEMSVLRDSFKSKETKITPIPTLDMARRIHIIPRWEDANKRIEEEDIPIGLECVTSTNPGKDNTFALRIIDGSMAPEFHPGDSIIIDECSSPKDGDFVLATDSKGKVPLLRQFKDYGKTKVLHALNQEHKDIVLDNDKRYSVVGKVIERISRSKLY